MSTNTQGNAGINHTAALLLQRAKLLQVDNGRAVIATALLFLEDSEHIFVDEFDVKTHLTNKRNISILVIANISKEGFHYGTSRKANSRAAKGTC